MSNHNAPEHAEAGEAHDARAVPAAHTRSDLPTGDPESPRDGIAHNAASSAEPATGADSENLREKRIFTTGEAAALCKVSQQTIIRCFDSGRLGGFRVPGSRFRRIPRSDLIKFMRANEIPTDPIEDAHTRVLVVEDDPAVSALIAEALPAEEFCVRVASTGYDAGLLTESFRPHLMILDYMLPDINGTVVCTRLRDNPALASTRVLIVSGVVDTDEIGTLKAAGADDFLKKPFSIDALLDKARALTRR